VCLIYARGHCPINLQHIITRTHTYIHNTRIQVPCHLCMLGLCARALPHQPAAHNYTHTHIHTQYTNTDALPFMHAWSMRERTAPSTCSTDLRTRTHTHIHTQITWKLTETAILAHTTNGVCHVYVMCIHTNPYIHTPAAYGHAHKQQPHLHTHNTHSIWPCTQTTATLTHTTHTQHMAMHTNNSHTYTQHTHTAYGHAHKQQPRLHTHSIWPCTQTTATLTHTAYGHAHKQQPHLYTPKAVAVTCLMHRRLAAYGYVNSHARTNTHTHTHTHTHLQQ